MTGPSYPMRAVAVRPPDLHNPNHGSEPIVSLQQDAAGRWWHVVGGEPVREATPLETLLPLDSVAWRALGTPAKATG